MKTLIKDGIVVNENKICQLDILIEDEYISKIEKNITDKADKIIDAKGLYVLPGIIDDQVHFREPGLTHKGDIYSESKAAVAGGITSFMEMPNTNPPATTLELLENKFCIAKKRSLANYSFFMGASNDNIEEVLKVNPQQVAAIKIFMGSSTGNMLVDDKKTLESIFKNSKMLIAVHCEDEETIKYNTQKAISEFGENIPIEKHPEIRSEEACYKSSSMAVELAKKYNTRLHVFHISTEKELDLFKNNLTIEKKRITCEVCIHHLWFEKSDYKKKGALIKWNPSVKNKSDRDALLNAIIENKIDVIATDHAPHTIEEKNNTYLKCPSGGPLVQHALNAMLELVKKQKISLEKVVEKMSHHPAICFQIEKRGFIRKNYFADLILVDRNSSWQVDKSNILYKCKWSPFEGQKFSSRVTHTFVNGHLAYTNGTFDESKKGKRLLFNRK
jgi:dihydroorotase